MEENDTALCLQKLAATENQKIILPVNIQPHVFTNIAWDNIDRLEETLTGKGTSHRVNGIAVQAKVYGPHPAKAALPCIEKRKQRTVSPGGNEDLAVYISSERVGPHPLTVSAQCDQQCKEQAGLARAKSLLWVLARQVDFEVQKIPGWTGFNIKTRGLVGISQDNIGYLPTIHAPATQLTTVFEILNQSELIRNALQLRSIVVVMDQAL